MADGGIPSPAGNWPLLDTRPINFQDKLTVEEVVKLGALDGCYFSQEFFPRTVRQASPLFHRDIWNRVDSLSRYIDLLVFRGGGKTSLLRLATAKKVAYGLSHTILYIGKSEGHAVRSVKWLRRQVEYNRKYREVFGLRPGSKWQDVECEIIHKGFDMPIWIMATGITGSVRGINQDDFRPDLIIVDDVLDEENTATPEGRKKMEDLIHGALRESLAPASEAPDAKLVMLQTPLHKEDAASMALNDPEWNSARYGCFTKETEDLSLHEQESIWPERWPSEVLRAEKKAALERNRASLWYREKECKLIAPETSAFVPIWLNFYDLAPERAEMTVIMSIDPVPPPSETEIAKGLRGKDYEAITVVGKHRDRFYLLDYEANRGHDPNWTVATFFTLALKWRPRKVLVESVAYQRTLAWILRQAMMEKRIYFVIEEFNDKRKKFDRIVDGISGPASNGQLWVRREHHEFISQFTEYPDCAHDDVIESVAVGLASLNGLLAAEGGSDDHEAYMEEQRSIPNLADYRGAP